MVENFDTIKSIINKYLDIVKKNKIVVEKVYLFGSYARGTATEDSDIDFAIISDDFQGDRFEDRRLLVPLRRKIDLRLEPIPFRPEDFHEYHPLAVEIIRNGIEL